MFALLFKDDDNYPTRNFFDVHYMLLVKIKVFNALIDNKPFFDQPVKSKQESYEKQITRNNTYVTVNVSDYFLH